MALAGPLAFGQVTYRVLPLSLENGYAIDGGTITTTGFTGTSSDATVITEFEISVSGNVPFVFSSSSSFVNITDLMFDEEAIYLPPLTALTEAVFGVSDLDASDPGCAPLFCVVDLQYNVTAFGNSSYAAYAYADDTDFDPVFGGGVDFDTQSRVVIARVPNGDYDSNGITDVADYQLWESSFASTTNLAADGNLDGRVDAADYTVWRDNVDAASTTIPEPASWLLLALTGLSLTRRRARR